MLSYVMLTAAALKGGCQGSAHARPGQVTEVIATQVLKPCHYYYYYYYYYYFYIYFYYYYYYYHHYDFCSYYDYYYDY